MDLLAQNSTVHPATNVIYNHNIIALIKTVSSVLVSHVSHMCKYTSSVGNKQHVVDVNLYFI